MKKILCGLLILFSSTSFAAHLATNVAELVAKCSCEKCDLVHAKLTGFVLGQQPAEKQQHDYLAECSLAQADLSFVNLDYAKFIGAGRTYALNISLKGAKLHNARLKYSEFYRVDATHADFSRANLAKASLVNSDFSQANFSRANLKYVTTLYKPLNLGSKMLNANFQFANLSNAELDATLDGANFNHANLTNASLDPAIIEIQGSTTTGFADMDFSYANLSHAKLYETTNAMTPFAKTNFSHANLKDGKFFVGHRFGETKPASLEGAIFCHTIMPDGKVNNRDCKTSSKT